MKFLYSGIILSAVGALISLAIWGVNNGYLIPGGLAAFFIGLAMIFSGSLVNGDQMRANFATETPKDRRERMSVTFRLALLGIPNLVVAVLLYFFL